MSKEYEICCTNNGHQFPYSSTNPENSAKGQAKKAEGKLMQTVKPLEVNSTKKQQQPNKYNNCKDEPSAGNNKSDDHIAIASKGHCQHPIRKEEQEISFNIGNLVTIWNYKPTVWNSNSDTDNVIGLAKRMGLSLTRDDIIDMDVYRESQNSFVYEVYFRSKQMKEAFLTQSHILKTIPETKSVVIY